jgi:hypothetical protein
MNPFDVVQRGISEPRYPARAFPVPPTGHATPAQQASSVATAQRAEGGLSLHGTPPVPDTRAGDWASLASLPRYGAILPANFAVSILSQPAHGTSWDLLGASAKELPPELYGPPPWAEEWLRDHPEWPDFRGGVQNWVQNRERLKRAVGKTSYMGSPRLQPDPRRVALDEWMREKLQRVALVVELAAADGTAVRPSEERAAKIKWADSDEGRKFADQCAEAVYNASHDGEPEHAAGKAMIAGIEIMWMLNDFQLCRHTIEAMSKLSAGLLKAYPTR